MTALRALLVAIFGGFIGAAPAAPVFLAADTAGGRGHSTDVHAHSQKREAASQRPEAAELPAATAPPGVDEARHPHHSPATGHVAPARPRFRPPLILRAALPAADPPRASAAIAAVRAGLLGLPPPRTR